MEIVPHSVTDYFSSLLEVFPTSQSQFCFNWISFLSFAFELLVNSSLFTEQSQFVRKQVCSLTSLGFPSMDEMLNHYFCRVLASTYNLHGSVGQSFIIGSASCGKSSVRAPASAYICTVVGLVLSIMSTSNLLLYQFALVLIYWSIAWV